MALNRWARWAAFGVLASGVLGCGPAPSGERTGSVAQAAEPAVSHWLAVAPMLAPHSWHTATRLTSNKVLLAGGGLDAKSAELYDPVAATSLTNGKVLVAGGEDTAGEVASGELYDPDTATWVDAGALHQGRIEHTATLLATGKVLVVGGFSNQAVSYLASAELYDPDTNTWSDTGALSAPRRDHAAASKGRSFPHGQVRGVTGV